MSDEQLYIDRAARVWQQGPNAEVAHTAILSAQISIAISLQRIADALERQPLMSAGIWDNTREGGERHNRVIVNPDMVCTEDSYTKHAEPSERELILAYLRTFDVGEDWNLARGLVADIEGNKHLLSFAGASPVGENPPIIVSQPATFESLAPTPLIELPAECWCSAGPSEPVHDPKYGSHDFGERPADKNYGGTD